MIIKKLTGALLLLMLSGVADAAEPKVSVVDREGNKTFFDRSEISSINLKTDRVEIIGTDGKTTAFDKKGIAVINLSDKEAKVETITKQGRQISIIATKDHIMVQNIGPSTAWRLFDAAGHVVKSGEFSGNDGMVSISDVDSGVYLFTVAGRTVKFIK